MEDVLLIDRDPPITWLKLNRPQVMNCLNTKILNAINEACAELADDHRTRIVVIIGAGKGAFSAGADLKERKGMTEGQLVEYHYLIQRTMLAVENLPQPTIAAINGSAFGGGTELSLACDLRIMVEEASLAMTEVRLGIMPGAGGTQRLPRLIGKSRAKELILTARRVSASEAKQIGLVHQLVEAGTYGDGDYHQRLQERARAWAEEIGQAAPLALRQAKWAVDNGFDRDLEAGLAIETKAYLRLINTRDRLEGLAAFAEKRKPVYRGE